MPLGSIHHNEVGVATYECSNCGYLHSHENNAFECCPQYSCAYCDANWATASQADQCHPEYECDNCGNYTRDLDHECDEYDEDSDSWAPPEPPAQLYPPEVVDIKAKTLLLVGALDNRPVRMCSIEQEISDGANAVARMLYDTGFSPYDRLMGYGTDVDPRWAVVKSDSSLPHGGGEVVYSRFDLSATQDVKRLSDAMARIRALREEGIVKTTTAAGTHIHISATDIAGGTIFGPKQMAALYEIFSYCEEVLFQLATAGWPGHRDTGAEFAKALRKFEKVSAGKVAMSFTHHDHRYFSLNFLRLLEAARKCSCGACISGDWDDCECNALRGGTIEWRVFNATTKPETMHAWVLLSHGLTAAAFTHQLGTLEPNAWQQTDPAQHSEIFDWVLSNCPFSDDERRVITNCARRVESLQIDWPEFEKQHPEWELDAITEPEFEEDQQPLTEFPPPIYNPTVDTFTVQNMPMNINWTHVQSSGISITQDTEDQPF